MTPADAATQAVHAFLETFNAQDHEAHAQTLNYPHVRLAGGRFARLESSEEFTAISSSSSIIDTAYDVCRSHTLKKICKILIKTITNN